MIKILGSKMLSLPVLRRIILVSLGVSGLLVVLYFLNFRGDISKSNITWGEFGEYISGTVGPILSFVNLLLFAGLTLKISDDDQHRWITQIRIDSYQDLKKKLYRVREETHYDGEAIDALRSELVNNDLNDYFFLFGEQEATFTMLQENLIKSLTGLDEALAKRPAPATPDFEKNSKVAQVGVENAFKAFTHEKNEMVLFLRFVIMKADTKVFLLQYHRHKK